MIAPQPCLAVKLPRGGAYLQPESVDVAVIGAGPGGLSAAIYAAKNGLKVRIFEKKSRIGFPTVCGELLPTEEEMKRLLPRADGIPELFDAAASAAVNKCRRIGVLSPLGGSWSLSFDAYILDRHRFESLLFEETRLLGVESTLGAPARLMLSGKKACVESPAGGAVEAEVVVAADGFPSRAAVEAGLPVREYLRPENLAACLQYRVAGAGVEEDMVEVYFSSRLAPGGYGWIIPKGNGEVNIGIGARKSALRGKAAVSKLLDSFVRERLGERYEPGKIVAKAADVLPVGGALRSTCNGRVLAVGDAAGMVMPTNGGGIPTALISGKIAGETAARHLGGGCALLEYERTWRRQIGEELENATKLRRIADRLMGSDRAVHWGFTFLGEKGVREVLTCKVPWTVSPLIKLV